MGADARREMAAAGARLDQWRQEYERGVKGARSAAPTNTANVLISGERGGGNAKTIRLRWRQSGLT